jgi:hypothetical protein
MIFCDFRRRFAIDTRDAAAARPRSHFAPPPRRRRLRHFARRRRRQFSSTLRFDTLADARSAAA